MYEELMRSLVDHDMAIDYGYKTVVMGLSMIVLVGYSIRYLFLKTSNELKTFFLSIMSLNTWNILNCLVIDDVILNVKGLTSYYDQTKDLNMDPKQIFNTNNHFLNSRLAGKSMKILFVAITSFILFHIFVSNSRQLKHLICTSSVPTKDNEKQIQTEVENDDQHSKGVLLKYVGLFFSLVFIGALIVPNRFLLSSSGKIIDNEFITIKFDHLFFAFNTIFIFQNISTITKCFNAQQNCRILFVVVYLTWIYNFSIITLTNMLMMIFNDLLVNSLTLISNLINGNGLYQDEENINFVTSILLSYLNHSVTFNCQLCSNEDLTSLMAFNLIKFKELFMNCLIVLNFSSLIVMPLIIWIILIELRYVKVNSK
ncbi:hypothetical protein CLIB1444_01S07162 [[Candida] jaroonii]|uniref:Uncharacterized protein n=1 Tax=[Candida] jaroonii TaxID=467808 RepID=A0ACA9Y0Z9_9ASCO|nr:hypothetical protein CLIB1444_01S07162 [[Candida] jaroonii]